MLPIEPAQQRRIGERVLDRARFRVEVQLVRSTPPAPHPPPCRVARTAHPVHAQPPLTARAPALECGIMYPWSCCPACPSTTASSPRSPAPTASAPRTVRVRAARRLRPGQRHRPPGRVPARAHPRPAAPGSDGARARRRPRPARRAPHARRPQPLLPRPGHRQRPPALCSLTTESGYGTCARLRPRPSYSEGKQRSDLDETSCFGSH